MARTLGLLRHAKSSWDDPTLDDHDRPLAPRGRRAAPLIGEWIAEHAPTVDLVVCSDALRTRQTWDLVAPELGGEPTVRMLGELYHGSPVALADVVRAAPKECSTLLLIGHNPGIERFASALVGAGDRDLRRRMETKFPTAAIALVALADTDWSKVAPGSGTLTGFVRPKDLG